MNFEGLQELTEDLLLSLSAIKDSWVLLGVVDANDVLDFNDAIAVAVEFGKSAFNKTSSVIIQVTSDDSQEFIILDRAISVHIESLKERSNIITSDL